MTYYHVYMSAETLTQAQHILDTLLTKKLIVGGTILQGPAKFWWKHELVSMNYCYIMAYTTSTHKYALMDEYTKASTEEVPMLSLVPFKGNQKLYEYIDTEIT